MNHGIQAFNHLIVGRDVCRSKVKWYQEFLKCCFKNKMLTIFYLNHHSLVISRKLCLEHSNKQQNRKLLQTFRSNPLTWVYRTIGCHNKNDGFLLIYHPWVSWFLIQRFEKVMFVTLLTRTFQFSLSFWETVHLPLPQANIKTHFSLRAKCWLRRGIAGQFPRYLTWSHFFKGVVPEALLKERLDVETLDTLGIIQSQKAFNQKYVRTKTKLLCVYFLDIS